MGHVTSVYTITSAKKTYSSTELATFCLHEPSLPAWNTLPTYGKQKHANMTTCIETLKKKIDFEV